MALGSRWHEQHERHGRQGGMSRSTVRAVQRIAIVVVVVAAMGAGMVMTAAVATTPAAATGRSRTPESITTRPISCDPIDPQQCFLPFPSDYFTVPATTWTGRRLQIPSSALPSNVAGTPIDTSDWSRNDGWSPGSAIMVRVPGLDLARTGIPASTDLGDSLRPDAPVVLLDVYTGERIPFWGELDTWNPDPATRALVVRPARNYAEGHRMVVALRNLKNAAGDLIAPPANFVTLRDGRPTSDPDLDDRRPAIEQVFDDLQRVGIGRQNLYLAWNFTVASEQGLSERLLRMRDDAYAQLGRGVPKFTITQVDENVNANVLRRVRGTFEVPSYLAGTGEPGSRMLLDADNWPQRNGMFTAEFRCIIPRSTVGTNGAAVRGRGVVYGHGLLGSTGEVDSQAPVANEKNLVVCGTPWIGMSNADLGNVYNVVSDFSSFASMPDRLQQGILNFQFLARLVKDPRGFSSASAFRVGTPARPVFVAHQVYFNGNSQGGILGGAATAISKEWTRAVLGVPGMNYSVLLPRSVDFDPFLPLVRAAYPDPAVHTLLVNFIQILWDRGEANAYAHHITDDPYPRTPKHQVLLIEAFGDHQVANIATENEARTIGAYGRTPVIAPGRSNDAEPFWDIAPTPRSKVKGSVVELWDFGTPAPPPESVPNRAGSDPHGAARNVPAVRETVSQFLRPNGFFFDLCGPGACRWP